MSQESSPKPDQETIAEALAREQKKTDDLSAKIDVVEKEVTPKRPPSPNVDGIFGD